MVSCYLFVGLVGENLFLLQLYKHGSWLVLLSGTSEMISSDWQFEAKFWHFLKNLKDTFLPVQKPFQGTRTSSDTRSKVIQNPVTPNKLIPFQDHEPVNNQTPSETEKATRTRSRFATSAPPEVFTRSWICGYQGNLRSSLVQRYIVMVTDAQHLTDPAP